MVHDIGKVAIPAEILTKPSRLSELEMKLVQEHVDVGYEILKDIPFSWPIAEMVRQHHERLDGTGYPRGLIGDQICPEARILAVADMFEAMASHRPYRVGKGIAATLEQVKLESGTSLDASVVEALLELVKDDGIFDSFITA
jgi:HD-GYP domain-containing protein (c-di-GMP phosphodiesterase class II)